LEEFRRKQKDTETKDFIAIDWITFIGW
jgi:hypothetical protein